MEGPSEIYDYFDELDKLAEEIIEESVEVSVFYVPRWREIIQAH